MTPAETAHEHTHNLGTPDYDVSSEVSDYEREEEERLEREGRREMYAMLFDA